MNDLSIPGRIHHIYHNMTQPEQAVLRQILEELSATGESPTYENVWLEDYKEIPVDINTFLEDERYLGKTNRKGEAVYPYWRKKLNELFDAGNQYEEVFFTGATRIGKSSTAITGIIYMLYRLMCLKDPQKYYEKKEVSKFSILFFNITKDLAKGVGFREFNDTLAVSPWFQEHGTFSKSERNFYYIPEGGKVVIDYGSSASHALGMQVFAAFCVVGDTEILTPDGYKKIEEFAGDYYQIAQYNGCSVEYHDSKVVQSGYAHNTITIELEDGTSFEGTLDHKVMLSNGEYVALKDLKYDDDIILYDVDAHIMKIKSIEFNNYDEAIPVYDVISAKPNHNFICKGGIVAHNCDEINFSRAGVKDVNKAKAHMKELYNTVVARVKGTFRVNGEVHGKVFAISSKKSDSDFMEAYIESQINAGASKHIFIADAPQWEVLPPAMFSKETFYVAVGDRHKRGFVVPDNQTHQQALNELIEQGYKLLQPPVDMRSDFLADFDIALRDLAGISIPGSLSFITQETLTSCVSDRKSPFYQDILQIGTKDNYTVEEFFHVSEIPDKLRHMPMFIHLDLSLNTDRTGISGVWISGRKDIVNELGKTISQPMFTHAFSIALEAPRGDKIPYAKITEFICWLRSNKFNINRISRDQFQSEYMAQLLEAQGFDVDKISLDRTPDGYMALRSILLEKRIDLLDCKYLQDELVHLQRDSVTGKIDHPVGGCFTGDTKIQLVDGRTPTILELLDEQKYKINEVYTVNETTLEIEIKRIRKVFPTKICSRLTRVLLNNGQIFTCTPEHRIMLIDGSYIKAMNLSVGQSLMSLPNESDIYKVIDVINISVQPCKVYDLTIEDNPNFGLAAGVFAHNSKDVADSLAGGVWNAMLTNPGVPVPTKKVASVIASINGGRRSY